MSSTSVSPVLRPAADADIPALAELHSRIHPDDALSADEYRHMDGQYVEPYRLGRFVAVERDTGDVGRVVGMGAFRHSIGSFHPQRFLVDVQVAPEARGRGVGAALWRRVRAELEPLGPLSLRATVREDDARALRFARDRGFAETKRDTPSALELADFEAAPFAPLRAELAAAGVRIAGLAELAAEGVAWERPWYEIFAEVRRDVPRSEPVTEIPFERYAEIAFRSPDFAPEFALAALHPAGAAEPRWIGMTQLWRGGGSGPGGDLYTGLTGTTRDWRRRGVALALKVASLERAAAQGYARVHTDNDERNAGMLAINRRLGFVPGPALLSMALEPVPPLVEIP